MRGNSSAYKINADDLLALKLIILRLLRMTAFMFLFLSSSIKIQVISRSVQDSIRVSYTEETAGLIWKPGVKITFSCTRNITGSETWTNDLPYVILSSLIVYPNELLLLKKAVAFMYMPMHHRSSREQYR